MKTQDIYKNLWSLLLSNFELFCSMRNHENLWFWIKISDFKFFHSFGIFNLFPKFWIFCSTTGQENMKTQDIYKNLWYQVFCQILNFLVVSGVMKISDFWWKFLISSFSTTFVFSIFFPKFWIFCSNRVKKIWKLRIFTRICDISFFVKFWMFL